MNDFTVLAVEPDTTTLVEVVCGNEYDLDECAKEAEKMGCKGVMAIMVMR